MKIKVIKDKVCHKGVNLDIGSVITDIDTENAENKLTYSVKLGDTDLASGDVVLTVDAGTAETATATLTTALVGTATVSGTYKDTITFTVNTSAPEAQG